MRRRGLNNNTSAPVQPNLNQTNLSFWLESQVEESFAQQTLNTSVTPLKAWTDLVSGQPCALKDNAGTNWMFTSEKALQNFENTQVVNITNYYNIAVGESFTFGAYLNYNGCSGNTANHWGFVSNSVNATVTGLFIDPLTDRPFIKIGNVAISNYASGTPLSRGVNSYITYSVTPTSYSICINGIEEYSGAHAKGVPAIEVRQLLRSYSESYVLLGSYKSLHFYRQALTPNENLSNYNSLLNSYT